MHPLLLWWGQWTPAPAESVSGTLIREGLTQFSKEPPSEMRHGGELASEQAGAEGKNSQTLQGFQGAHCGRKARSLTLLNTRLPPGPCPPSWAPSCIINLRVSTSPRVSLPEDATGLNRAQHVWLRPGAPNPTFPGTAGDPGAHWGRGGCEGSKWGWEGAEAHRVEPSEPGSGPGAMRKLRSLLPWTAIWEDFLGLASLRDHWVAVRGFLFCFWGHLEMQSYWYFLSLELQHQLQNNLWKHLQTWSQLHLYCPPELQS